MEEPMPSHEDRRRFADGTQHLPPAAKLTIEDLEMMDEEEHNRPVRPGTAAEGIASLHRRLSLLRSQIAKVETRLAEDWPAEAKASLREDLAQLQTQQGIAERRLADYQGQLKTLN